MPDVWLPRIVAVGLLLIAILAVVGVVYLRSNGVDGSTIATVASTSVGALAAFLAGQKFNVGGSATATTSEHGGVTELTVSPDGAKN